MPTNGKGRKDNALRQETNPFLEHASGYESVGESKREERDAEGHDDRHRVRIISKRVRICDPEMAAKINLVGKNIHAQN